MEVEEERKCAHHFFCQGKGLKRARYVKKEKGRGRSEFQIRQTLLPPLPRSNTFFVSFVHSKVLFAFCIFNQAALRPAGERERGGFLLKTDTPKFSNGRCNCNVRWGWTVGDGGMTEGGKRQLRRRRRRRRRRLLPKRPASLS